MLVCAIASVADPFTPMFCQNGILCAPGGRPEIVSVAELLIKDCDSVMLLPPAIRYCHCDSVRTPVVPVVFPRLLIPMVLNPASPVAAAEIVIVAELLMMLWESVMLLPPAKRTCIDGPLTTPVVPEVLPMFDIPAVAPPAAAPEIVTVAELLMILCDKVMLFPPAKMY